MSALRADVGVDARAQLDAYAARTKLSTSDALRIVVVRGLGGDAPEALAANAFMAGKRRKALAALGITEPRAGFDGLAKRAAAKMRGAKRRFAGEPKSWVNVRLPLGLARRVTSAGGLRRVVLAGLKTL